MAHRLVMDGVNRLPAAAEAGRLSHLLEAPASTGDQRWDALLAAAVRYRLHELGREAPAWTVKEPLNVFWWPTRISASQQYNAMAHTPAEFRRLGIFIDGGADESLFAARMVFDRAQRAGRPIAP